MLMKKLLEVKDIVLAKKYLTKSQKVIVLKVQYISKSI